MTEPTTLPLEPVFEESCLTCRFWEEGRKARGLCRRYPLVLEATTWPATGADDWCGEYREKVKENGTQPPS